MHVNFFFRLICTRKSQCKPNKTSVCPALPCRRRGSSQRHPAGGVPALPACPEIFACRGRGCGSRENKSFAHERTHAGQPAAGPLDRVRLSRPRFPFLSPRRPRCRADLGRIGGLGRFWGGARHRRRLQPVLRPSDRIFNYVRVPFLVYSLDSRAYRMLLKCAGSIGRYSMEPSSSSSPDWAAPRRHKGHQRSRPAEQRWSLDEAARQA